MTGMAALPWPPRTISRPSGSQVLPEQKMFDWGRFMCRYWFVVGSQSMRFGVDGEAWPVARK